MTPEQRAVEQWLSRRAPAYNACCCVGRQRLDGQPRDHDERTELTVTSFGPDRVAAAQVIQRSLKLSFSALRAKLSETPATFNVELGQAEHLAAALVAVGATVDEINVDAGYYPACPCGMRTVEEADGAFYQVTEHRTPAGVTHTARLLGPVGGPYVELSK